FHRPGLRLADRFELADEAIESARRTAARAEEEKVASERAEARKRSRTGRTGAARRQAAAPTSLWPARAVSGQRATRRSVCRFEIRGRDPGSRLNSARAEPFH